MRYYHLDGRRMTGKEAAHRYLARKLGFPAHYGHNLDALNDCLWDMPELNADAAIILHRPDALLRRLGDYGETLLTVLSDNAEQKGWRFTTSAR